MDEIPTQAQAPPPLVEVLVNELVIPNATNFVHDDFEANREEEYHSALEGEPDSSSDSEYEHDHEIQ